MPNPKFNVTLSDRESTILSPASIDSAHGGRSSLLKQRDAILSARIPDLNTRNTWAEVCCDNENRRPCVIRAGDRGRFVSTELPRRGAKWLTDAEGGGVSCGNVGDEGGDDVVGRRTTVTNEEVEGSSDICDVLEANASERLGLNYKTRRNDEGVKRKNTKTHLAEV